MKKKEIKVLTIFNNIQKDYVYMAIIDDFVIKYIDLDNNKMIIDVLNDVIRRENSDYIIHILLRDNIIKIYVKKIKVTYEKVIQTLIIKKDKNSYLVRYFLTDEKELCEYFVNF